MRRASMTDDLACHGGFGGMGCKKTHGVGNCLLSTKVRKNHCL